MRSPVSLSADLDMCGLMGRPQVLGGTHRLAVMLAIDPDRPVPVSFHASLTDAQETLGERY